MEHLITRILVPSDFSESSDAALEYTRMLADRFGASLHLVHVLHEPLLAEGLAAEAFMSEPPAIRAGLVDDARAHLSQRATGTSSADVVFGHTATRIVESAARLGIDSDRDGLSWPHRARPSVVGKRRRGSRANGLVSGAHGAHEANARTELDAPR